MPQPLDPIEWTVWVLLGLALSPSLMAQSVHTTPPLLCQQDDGRMAACPDAKALDKPKLKTAQKPKPAKDPNGFKAKAVH